MNNARTSSRAHGPGISVAPDSRPTPIVRQYIAERVSIEHRGYITPCWVWQGCVNHHGYAVATMPKFGRARVHRAVYEEYVGPIPDGLQIDHLCGVKPCCNPAHLEPVTLRENLERFWATLPPKAPRRSRATGIAKLPATHCRNGHEYTPENTRTNSQGSRMCQVCRSGCRKRYKQRHPDKVRAERKRYAERKACSRLQPTSPEPPELQ